MRRHVSRLVVAAAVGWAAAPARGVEGPPPVVFEGFGLEGLSTGASAAAASRGLAMVRGDDQPSFGVVVRGPTGPETATAPLAAEVRSRIESFDVAAGVKADRGTPDDGPAGWTGRIGVTSERESGREVFELRTRLESRHPTGMLGFEVGPRIERRLRRGGLFFIDGKAEAMAARAPETGAWTLPGSPEAGGLGAVGVTARTGFSR